MMPRKLSQAQERQVAIAYLCGISEGYIHNEWGICWGLAKQVITERRSREWHDPLVDFYKELGRRHSYHNAAHLYLSCNGFKVDNRDLVDRVVDESSYRAIEEELYLPAIRHAAENSWLGRFLAPTNGYERLLDKVVGTGVSRTKMILRHVFPDALLASYLGDKRFTPSDAASAAEASLVGKVKRGEFHITPKKAVLIDELLQDISYRRRRAVRERFGIPSGDGKSLEQVGKKRGYTRERIRQFESEALYTLSLDSRMRVFEALALPFGDDDIPRCRARLNEPFAVSRVAGLELSVKARNRLLKAGITEVVQLAGMSEEELICLNGFGQKCLQEVKYVLSEQGLSLRGDNSR